MTTDSASPSTIDDPFAEFVYVNGTHSVDPEIRIRLLGELLVPGFSMAFYDEWSALSGTSRAIIHEMLNNMNQPRTDAELDIALITAKLMS